MGDHHWNIFRILADLSHLSAKCILVFSIHRNRSAEGVSLITQILYTIVFCTRYTDLFKETKKWNYFFKIFYLLSSFYTICIMRWVYPRTREREIAWKMGALVLGGSLLLSPFMMLIFESKIHWSFRIWLIDFSQVLESVCVLPQLLLLRQTTVPTVITSFYIVFLGSYRGLYVLNWIWKALVQTPLHAVSVITGVIQTALYLDFAWVYWTRQRVKLRDGAVVDADDLRRGWLLNRIFGKHVDTVGPEGDDEESAPALSRRGRARGNGANPRSKWGSRGISISADDGVLDREQVFGDDDDEEHGISSVPSDPDAKMQDPDELARVLDEEDDEDSPLPGVRADSRGESSELGNGAEWRNS